MLRAVAAAALAAAAPGAGASDTPFPDGILGVWAPKPGVTPQAILGPLSYTMLNWPDEGPTSKGGFSALRDRKTGDVWFTLLMGQVFHISGNEMQYCFGELDALMEQSPFSVDSVGADNATFCWRKGCIGMPTHKAGCTGCECAKIEIKLTAADELEFTFWMPAPVVHAHLTMIRHKKEPSMFVIESTMANPYKKCNVSADHYGPNLKGEPDLRNHTAWPNSTGFEQALAPVDDPRLDDPEVRALAGMPRGCARGLLQMAKGNKQLNQMLQDRMAELNRTDDDVAGPEFGKKKCHKLNGYNALLNEVQVLKAHKTVVPDVRLQYVKPKLPCNPCDVSYSVSAAIDEDEYIALGFKGQSWEHMFPYPPEYQRPCYFGMCVDAFDNFTADRIALGYASSAHGSCVREVGLKGTLVGKPVDMDYPLLKSTSVERSGGRTVVRFTVSQYWPKYKRFPSTWVNDGPFRTMWAIGKMTDGEGCDADFGYHGINKGMSPVDWLWILGSLPCEFSDAEMGM